MLLFYISLPSWPNINTLFNVVARGRFSVNEFKILASYDVRNVNVFRLGTWNIRYLISGA